MKTSLRRARALCVVAAGSVVPALAQVGIFQLEPVTVTGSGTPRTLGSEIASTSVLTRGDIERSGARDAVAVLNMLGTALVEQQGGPGTLASVRIRGADTRDTLVLIDGVPINEVTSGGALIQQIPADMIERVEVVRGNLSPLYGANAAGGVVQIFTRRGEKGGWQPSVSAGVGSRSTRTVNAGLATGNDVVRARIGLGGERTDGFSAANPATAPTANPDDDGNRRHHATLAVDATAAAGHRVSLDLRRVDGKVEYDSTESFSTPTDTHAQHLEQTGASLNGEHALRGDWTLAWRWAESREKRKDNGESAFGPFEFDNSVRNRVLSVELNGSPLAGWRTQVGVERLAQKTDIPSYTRQTRDTEVVRLGAFHEASWGSLQANLRHDKTSDFGDATTGLLGGKLKLAQGLSAFASASTGFTPPTLDFLFFDCAPFVCSNPDLRPEESRNAELALQWQDARTLARATAFAARYRDKIANDENFVPRNLNRVKNQGLELSVRHAVADWTFLGEAAFQNPVDETTGERLIRRAKQQFSLRADYQQPRWHAGAGVRYVGARRDNGDLEAGAYTVVDLSGHLTLAPQWTLQASVDNLFDRHYEPTIGYNGRPRWLFVGVSWTPRE